MINLVKLTIGETVSTAHGEGVLVDVDTESSSGPNTVIVEYADATGEYALEHQAAHVTPQPLAA
ncbi:hypothetical protein [Streptomyces sp. H34-S4]|uniref:hypothetical protein n=1 Tax=Streptomyces sp. H34-S4 TaxID=2996463 RepID=UPI0022713FB0|nr:hypothetical protein [Streptomyces sp. H34-S4]MCY0933645.1 hypothetical protein [Streptomyces sp. H34-S4]